MNLIRLTLTLALAVGVRGLDEEMAEIAKMIREECISQSDVDPGLIDQVNAGAQLMADQKLKCYIACTMETAGMMEDGAVDVEAILALLPDDMRQRSEATIRGCGSPRGADHCDVAFRAQECWQTTSPQYYMLL